MNKIKEEKIIKFFGSREDYERSKKGYEALSEEEKKEIRKDTKALDDELNKLLPYFMMVNPDLVSYSVIGNRLPKLSEKYNIPIHNLILVIKKRVDQLTSRFSPENILKPILRKNPANNDFIDGKTKSKYKNLPPQESDFGKLLKKKWRESKK